MAQDKIMLVNPVAKSPDEKNAVAAPLGDLSGKRLGLRGDDQWKSFEVFSTRLLELLAQRYPLTEIARHRNSSRGRMVERDGFPAFLSFAEGIDGAILGLGA
ncbi:MAG: hypothetical protein ABIH46_00055 [Chloroflexota bacterium]